MSSRADAAHAQSDFLLGNRTRGARAGEIMIAPNGWPAAECASLHTARARDEIR